MHKTMAKQKAWESETNAKLGSKFNISNTLTRIFYILYFVVLLWLCINVWLNANNALLFLGGAAFYIVSCVLFVRFFANALEKMSKRMVNTMLATGTVLYFALVFFMGFSMRIYPDYDFGEVYLAALEFVNTGQIVERADYFMYYKNNMGLLLIVSFTYKIASLFGYVATELTHVLPGLILNAFCISLSVFCAVKTIHIMFKRNVYAVLGFLLFAVFLPYYLWAPSFYSHSVSMPFVSLSVLLYVISRNKKPAQNRLFLALSVLCATLGYLVKGSVLIVVIAIFICEVLSVHKLRAKIINLLIIIVVCAAVLFLFDLWVFNNSAIDYSAYDERALPFSFWFSMGSHGEGKWDGADRQFALGFDTTEERNAALWQRTFDYYAQYTPQTYYEFLHHKIMATWGDGKFGAQISHNNPIGRNWSMSLVFEGSLLFGIATVHSQFMLQMIYWLNLISLGFCFFKPNGKKRLLLHLCVFGLLLFLVFWESWASYVLNFTPILIISAMGGVCALSEMKFKSKAQLNAKVKEENKEYAFSSN